MLTENLAKDVNYSNNSPESNSEIRKQLSSIFNLKDLEELHQKRGLPTDWCFENVKRATAAQATQLLGYQAKSDGLWIEGYGGQGQFKPDEPWEIEDLKTGKKSSPKYLTPKSEYSAFLPLHPQMGDKLWTDIEEIKKHCIYFYRDPIPYIILTEGAFKAISGCSFDILTIGLLGVWMGLTSKVKGKRYLLPILQKYADAGFGFIIAFDADCTTNKNVLSAQDELAKALTLAGSPVRIATGLWTVEQGKGMDDFIQNYGANKFKNEVLAKVKLWEKQVEPSSRHSSIPPADEVAHQIAEEYRGKLIYNNESGGWMRYEAEHLGVWTPEKDDYMEFIVSSILDSKGIKGYGSHIYVINIIKKMCCLLMDRKWLESSAKDFMPFENGVLEVRTRKILPHSPNFRFTWTLPRQYNPLANNWDTISSWLDEATAGHEDLKKILLCFCNAVLKGRSDLQKYLHLMGNGGTGKGTFFRLLVSLIGECNTCTSNLHDWCGNQFESANGYRKRLILFWDEDKYSGKTGKFKSLTGGDFIRGEQKGKAAFHYVYDGMVAISSNFPVFVNESSSGLARRKLIIPFTATPKAIDTKLQQKFELELDAFINYVLSIDDDVVTNTILGKEKPATVSFLSWDEQMMTDSVAWWLNGYVIRDASSETQIGNKKDEAKDGGIANVATLFGSYYQRCLDAGRTPKSLVEFSRHLMDLSNNILGWSEIKKVEGRRHNAIRGLRLRKEGSDDHIPTIEQEIINRMGASSSTPSTNQSQQALESSTLPSTASSTASSTVPEELVDGQQLLLTLSSSPSVEGNVEGSVEGSVEGTNPYHVSKVEGVEDKGEVFNKNEYLWNKGECVRIKNPESPYDQMTAQVEETTSDAWVKVILLGKLPKEAKKKQETAFHYTDLERVNVHENTT
jgi:putative DNA primase/helicase